MMNEEIKKWPAKISAARAKKIFILPSSLYI
jgi:hypothetical protein